MTEETALVEGVSEDTAAEVTEVDDSEDQTTEVSDDADDDDQSDATLDEDDSEDEQPEEIEFDFGGNKLRVPKDKIPEEVAAEVDRFTKGLWSDYTKKSQTVAEQTKAIEARVGVVEKLESLSGEALQTYSHGLHLKQEVEQLRQIDLNALWQSNPDQARRVSDTISAKDAELRSVVEKVAKYESELENHRKAETARLVEEGKKAVTKHIPDFEARAPEVIDYVTKAYGVPKEHAETWPLNPAAAQMAYKAMLYDQLQAKASAKAKPKPAEVKPVTPVKSSGKGGKPKLDLVKDADKMPFDKWQKEYAKAYGK